MTPYYPWGLGDVIDPNKIIEKLLLSPKLSPSNNSIIEVTLNGSSFSKIESKNEKLSTLINKFSTQINKLSSFINKFSTLIKKDGNQLKNAEKQ